MNGKNKRKCGTKIGNKSKNTMLAVAGGRIIGNGKARVKKMIFGRSKVLDWIDF